MINTENNNHDKRNSYLIFFSMLYMCLMLFNATLTNRYISLNKDFFILGGTLTSPLFFILGDIIAEIFGYKITKKLIFSGFTCLIMFAILCEMVIKLPYPDFFKESKSFSVVFGPLFYIVMSSLFAYIIGGLINAKAITKWKVLLNGRYFWLRSLGASTISEGVYTVIAIVMMEISYLSINHLYKVILISYLIKISYSIILALPANLVVYYLKTKVKIDDDQIISDHKYKVRRMTYQEA